MAKESVGAKTGGEGAVDFGDTCLVCTGPLDFVAIGCCNHQVCCALCSMRMRILLRNQECVYCKQNLERVFIVSRNMRKKRRFEGFKTYGDSAGPGYVFHEASGSFIELSNGGDEQLGQLQSLWEFRCVEKGCPQSEERFANKDQLTKHLKEAHGLFVCELCWDHKAEFPGEQARYTSKRLKQHLKEGNSATGETGHPWCKFCKKGFYNDEMLYAHLNKDHESCHICRKQGKTAEYYRDRKALFRHFKGSHVVCPEKQCLEAFKVFPDEIGLHNHNRMEHPEKAQTKHVPVVFNVKRAGYDGSGIEQNRNEHGDSSQEDEIRLDSFAFAYRPGQNENSTPRELSGNSDPMISSAGPTNHSGRWANAAGAFNVGSRLHDTSQFPTLASEAQSGGGTQNTWGPKPSTQSSHNSFANAIGGGHGNLRFYSRAQRDRERRKRGGAKGAGANASSRSATEQQNIQASTITSAYRAPTPPVASTGSSVPLTERIRIALNRDSTKFREFQELCGGLNQRKIAIGQFYPRVAQLLGRSLSELLPQLVETLPDKSLAHELLGFHTAAQLSRDLSHMSTSQQNTKPLPRKAKWAQAASGTGGAAQPRTSNRVNIQQEDFPALVSDVRPKQQRGAKAGANGNGDNSGRKSAVVRLYTPQSKAVAKKKGNKQKKKKKKKNATSVIDMF